ncbi:MAG: DUF2157 domain-containing protein [Akkermansia sp.]|nr:DUF2157 domain-containing protein [Akkermansia sp.]
MKRKDIEKILAARLISPAQCDAIVEHFRLNEKVGLRWLLICLSALASILIVSGLVMLISANWYSIPPLLKMVCCMLLMVGCWVAWYWQRESRPIVSEVLGFCGAGAWLGCIALYGQIFQLQNPFVEGCTLFFAGIALIPFICRQRFLIWVVVAASFIELGALGTGRDSYLNFYNWLPGWEDDYTPFALVLLGTVWWCVAEKWNAASSRWNSYSWVAPVLLLLGVNVAQGMMYTELNISDLDEVEMVFMGLIPVVLLLLKPRGMQWMPWCGMSAVISLVFPCFYLMDVVEADIVGILIYFCMALVVMFSGVKAMRMSWINIGSLMVVLTAIALVADVLDSYTFSGLVLVAAGLLLLGLGVLLEKSRRHLILAVKNSQPSTPEA